MIDKKASISNASLVPRRISIMVKEPMKRKIINIINVAGNKRKEKPDQHDCTGMILDEFRI